METNILKSLKDINFYFFSIARTDSIAKIITFCEKIKQKQKEIVKVSKEMLE